MKNFFIALMICGFFGMGCLDDSNKSAGNAESAAVTDSASFTDIQWIDSVKDMGRIMEGQKLEVVFRFKNAGSKPLVIQSAQPSCGCTVPSKPDQPIMPGQQGEIKAVFDSKGRSGSNHKSITVMANTNITQSHVLLFNVEVIGEKDGPKALSGPQS
jgi:hypothetical protein